MRKVGGLQNINIETIISLQPDVVLIGSIIPKKEVEKLEKSGLTVIALKQEENLEGVLKVMETLGKIVDNPQGADSIVQFYSAQLERFKKNTDGAIYTGHQNPTVYYVVGFGAAGDFTAPANSHINEIIRYAGGRNIGDTLSTWNISREYLFTQNPDLIFIRTEELPHFVKTYPYNLLDAVKENRVYPIKSGWIDLISPRNFLAIEEIGEKIQVLLSEKN